MPECLKYKMETSACLPQFLKLYNDIVIFAGKDVITKRHSHHAIEILLSFDSQVALESVEGLIEARGLLLQHDILHTNKGTGFILFIFINPESTLGRRLNYLLNGNILMTIPEAIVEKARVFICDLLTHEFSENEISAYLTKLLVEDIALTERNYTPDIRIDNVVSHIKSNLHKPPDFKTLKDIACLSESRLIHLFKKELGIPIRRYVLWHRLQKAIVFYLEGHTLTQSAYITGFSDVAHFTRTFVSMFGMPPSHILKSFN